MKNIYNFSRREETQQAFRRLNLINAFIFSASTEKPENAKFIAKLIIERATGKKVGEISVTQEKTKIVLEEQIREKSKGRNHDLSVVEYKVLTEEIRYNELKESARKVSGDYWTGC